jgi:hypothetical protein
MTHYFKNKFERNFFKSVAFLFNIIIVTFVFWAIEKFIVPHVDCDSLIIVAI